jgi:hypothetical protein
MTVHTNDWTFWRGAICQKFGTTNWKRKKQYAFDQDKFVPGETPVAEWVTRQYKRLQAFESNGSAESVNFRLLGLMSGEVEYTAKNAMRTPDSDISTLINVLEDIVDKTCLGRTKYRQAISTPAPKHDGDKGSAKKPLSEVKCFVCKKYGHTSCNCKQTIGVMSEEIVDMPTNDSLPVNDELVIGPTSSGTMVVEGRRGKNNLVAMKCAGKTALVLLATRQRSGPDSSGSKLSCQILSRLGKVCDMYRVREFPQCFWHASTPWSC